VNGPVWKGESDRLSETELDTHRRALRWQTDQQLREAYEIYRGALALAEEWPPSAARVQYFIAAWRELRRRRGNV
jgi:hypothetical protein